MSTELVRHEPETPAALAGHQAVIPATIADAGDAAAYRFFEYFTARIPNRNTRRAYHGACRRFFDWIAKKGVPLASIRPPHVAIYLEELQANEKTRPTAKQALSALTGLF